MICIVVAQSTHICQYISVSSILRFMLYKNVCHSHQCLIYTKVDTSHRLSYLFLPLLCLFEIKKNIYVALLDDNVTKFSFIARIIKCPLNHTNVSQCHRFREFECGPIQTSQGTVIIFVTMLGLKPV